MTARCPECGVKFKDPLLFYANAALADHIATHHSSEPESGA